MASSAKREKQYLARAATSPATVDALDSVDDGKVTHIISLGAGVQSSTMALMAAHGEIEPMPKLAIFADTGFEPSAVYRWLDWLEQQLPFPVVRVTAGNIRDDQMNKRRTAGMMSEKQHKESRFASMPYFTQNGVLIRRQCTKEYKIQPIEKYLRRELLRLKHGQHAPKHVVITQWQGISADEAQRMKPARNAWQQFRYPLAMEHKMTRADCVKWMVNHGYPIPPRSACLACPYHSNDEWKSIKRNPDEWQQVVKFDKAIRHAAGLEHATYLHRSCKPIDEVDFSKGGQLDLFGEECEGVCGV